MIALRPLATLSIGVAALTAAVAVPSAQTRQLTIEAIFDPARGIDVDAPLPAIDRWLDDEHYVRRASRPDATPLLRVHADTGRTDPLFDASAAVAALDELPGVSATTARDMVWASGRVLRPDAGAMVVDHANDLYYYVFDTARAHRLTHTADAETEVSFSPDGTLVAFVREHDLFAVDVDRRTEYALTTDGTAQVRNGRLDWVYQEEIYGRGEFTGYWWSPDSTRIAYLRLDDTQVPTFPIVDHIAYHPELEQWEYPKAGDANPDVQLGVVSAAGGPTTWIDLDRYEPSQPLVVDVGWSPDGRQVVFQIQDREQTWLDLNVAEPGGDTLRLLRETTPAWVNVNGPPRWLDDGSFVWLSERSGWRHLYHYGPDGTLSRQLTDGAWEVREVHGIDEEERWIYLSGTERTHIGSDVYRLRLDGSSLTRLTETAGTHRARFNPGLTRYLDTWSAVTTPPAIDLHDAAGRTIRHVAASDSSALDGYRLSTPEFVEVTNRDGFVMNAMMIRPPDFDSTRRYPVYQHVYGGPHVQRVRDAWGGSTYLYWQLLAQHGIIVWVLDNSTASGQGAVSTWPVYQDFGAVELRDLEDGVEWLRSRPYVDSTRIGLEGWSYGGFMVCYALTHSESFSMGIAGGSVTDWRDYDTIYTERYMRMPQNNPEGYRRSSPRFAAGDLHGALLLVHGTMDENVHMQNTLQFAHELQKAGKVFDMMLYPRSRHRLGGPELEQHRHTLMLDFALRHLDPETAEPAETSARR